MLHLLRYLAAYWRPRQELLRSCRGSAFLVCPGINFKRFYVSLIPVTYSGCILCCPIISGHQRFKFFCSTTLVLPVLNDTFVPHIATFITPTITETHSPLIKDGFQRQKGHYHPCRPILRLECRIAVFNIQNCIESNFSFLF